MLKVGELGKKKRDCMRRMLVIWSLCGEAKKPFYMIMRVNNGLGWSFKGFYKGRWEIFIDEVIDCIKQNKKCELDILDDKIKTWEWEWVNGTESYSDQPIGNPIQVSKIMYEKYANKLKGVYGIALK